MAKTTTKVITAKTYNAMANARREEEVMGSATKALELQAVLSLTYCNLDCPAYDQWVSLGLTSNQCMHLSNRVANLADDTWLVVTVTN